MFGMKEIREREIAERESVKRGGFSLVWSMRELGCVWFEREVVKREIGEREYEKREIGER